MCPGGHSTTSGCPTTSGSPSTSSCPSTSGHPSTSGGPSTSSSSHFSSSDEPYEIDGVPYCPWCHLPLQPRRCANGRVDHINRYFVVCENVHAHPLGRGDKLRKFWHWYPLYDAPEHIMLLSDNSWTPLSSPASSTPARSPATTIPLPALSIPQSTPSAPPTSAASQPVPPSRTYPPLGPFVAGSLKCIWEGGCTKSAPNQRNSRCTKTMCKKHCIAADHMGCSTAKDHNPESAGKLQKATLAAQVASSSSSALPPSAPALSRPMARPPSLSLPRWSVPELTDEEWGLNPQFDDLSVLSEVAVNFPDLGFSSIDSPALDGPLLDSPTPHSTASFSQPSRPPPSQTSIPRPSQLNSRQPRIGARSAPTTQLNDDWVTKANDASVQQSLLHRDEQEQLARAEESTQEIEVIVFITNDDPPIKLALQGSNAPSHQTKSAIPYWPYFDLVSASKRAPQLPNIDDRTLVDVWDKRRKDWLAVVSSFRFTVKHKDVLVFRINGVTRCPSVKDYTAPSYRHGLSADRSKIRAKLKQPARVKRTRSPTPEPMSSSPSQSSVSSLNSPPSSSEASRPSKRQRTVSPFALSPNRTQQMAYLALQGGPQPPGCAQPSSLDPSLSDASSSSSSRSSSSQSGASTANTSIQAHGDVSEIPRFKPSKI
ncbi:hypothetical protein CONPUDRAFT_160784, partial [Coniophora puteana RWD-64-598 SS2]